MELERGFVHRLTFACDGKTMEKIDSFLNEKGLNNRSEAIREIIKRFYSLKEHGITWDNGLSLTDDGARTVIRWILLEKKEILDDEIKRLREVGQ